jgi:hypothetical protein
MILHDRESFGVHSYIPMISEIVPVVDPEGAGLLLYPATCYHYGYWK